MDCYGPGEPIGVLYHALRRVLLPYIDCYGGMFYIPSSNRSVADWLGSIPAVSFTFSSFFMLCAYRRPYTANLCFLQVMASRTRDMHLPNNLGEHLPVYK
jgi:hypothetical protein